MEQATQTLTQNPIRVMIAAAVRLGSGTLDVLDILTTSYARGRQLEQLFDMSDSELATLGIRRDEIVRHVFREDRRIR